MAMDPMLSASMRTQTAYYARRTGQTAHGDPTFAPTVAFPCRAERVPHRVRNAQGNEVTVNATITTETEVRIGDVVWPPGSDPADSRMSQSPVLIARAWDEAGNASHWEIHL